MRMKKEIADLQARAALVEFPIANHKFNKWEEKLKEILTENLGYRIAKTLEYDEYEQNFSVFLEVSNMLSDCVIDTGNPDDQCCMTLSKRVIIEYNEPLVPQIEEINRVREHLYERHNRLRALLMLNEDNARKRTS